MFRIQIKNIKNISEFFECFYRLSNTIWCTNEELTFNITLLSECLTDVFCVASVENFNFFKCTLYKLYITFDIVLNKLCEFYEKNNRSNYLLC